MKTKEQILAHLKSVGYSNSAIQKIMGFLIGNGTKTATEQVRYVQGDHSFEDFFEWYQTEESYSDSCPVCTMFKLLFHAMDVATEKNDLEVLSYLDELMNVMLDTFIEDTTNGNE